MLSNGDVFAGYTIERLLGSGGMGAVYLAKHPRLPRMTALKLLHTEMYCDTTSRTRFIREADTVAQLEHPNIVTVYDTGLDDNRLWISMQYVDGADAAAIRSHELPPHRALQIIADTGAALDYAHSKGVLHRDVKPANILLARPADQGGERTYLSDFGIARFAHDTIGLTETGTFTATLAFAAPEQLTGGDLDHRADQYSLACTLYALLTGAGPFPTSDPAVLIQAHLYAPPPPLTTRRPDLPRALDAVLAKALAKSPAHRYTSCLEFAAAAQYALESATTRPEAFHLVPSGPGHDPLTAGGRPPGPVVAPPDNVPYPAPGPNRPRIATVAVITTVLVVIIAIVIGIIGRLDDALSRRAVPTEETAAATTVPATVHTASRSRTIDAVTANPARATASAISLEFPALVPASSEKHSGHEGVYCWISVSDLIHPPNLNTTIDFKDWKESWICDSSHYTKPFVRIYAYETPAAAAAVIDGLPASTTRTVDMNGGTGYTNYRITESFPAIITTFAENPNRAQFLLYAEGATSMEDVFAWWSKAPLG
ncbi:serine/threonine-protein kinase [Nocardia carnea]|uniref:serine/threonine-protein kinase n=1 Tax=Nocardia carnea TaxID=37328 RepID=UPI0024537980|nr:serine/threonine-protein kinase [Nocardia carnea]